MCVKCVPSAREQEVKSSHNSAAEHLFRDNCRSSDPQAEFGSSTALDPEFFRGTAVLACEREILEFTAEQNWRDTENDHFGSAVRTRRRSSCFERGLFTSHVVSFRRSEDNGDPSRVPVVELKIRCLAVASSRSFSMGPGLLRMTGRQPPPPLNLRHNADASHGKR